MGFLHKLWDETLAGPPPEAGLSKLRKHDSFKAVAYSLSPPVVHVHDDVPISRSITIIKTHPTSSADPSTSFLDSPSAGSATPRTPVTPETPGGYVTKFTRRKKTEG